MKSIWLKAINFEEANCQADGGEYYYNLPTFKDDTQFISCWKVPFLKRVKFLITGKIWLCLEHKRQSDKLKDLFGGKSYHQPSSMTVDSPFGK